ncbi:2OG-Fe(II) oxygenase [Luteibacter sp. 9133]|uniref:2OG-Fe(II) oxygenase n=1 Tax=Luteibacter sp. 9133 TaxID=1500891 RepID=UPI0005BB364F|nr:2OG-Fe(II) oxygenase [Luteibacter sp. 9133]
MDTRRHTRITPEWHTWIGEALAAGSAPAKLLTTMRENDFDEAAARTAIADALFGGPATRAAPAWHTPGSRLAEGHVLRTSDRDVRVLLRIARPTIAVLDGVLDDAECEGMIEQARSRLARSAVVSPESGANTVMGIRTSEGAFFQRGENPLVLRIDRRAAEIMRLPHEHGEGLQVMRYGVGGEYVPHFDYFPPDQKGSEPHLAQGGQRVSTLIMYLADVEAGGETIFPRIDFSYVPRKGQALYFEYTDADGSLDVLSLHGGAPVTQGEKWIVTKWMRQRSFVG